MKGMFVSRKKWEELNERVRKLEAKAEKDIWDSNMVETFEYGPVSVKTMIKLLAAHLYKEEIANGTKKKFEIEIMGTPLKSSGDCKKPGCERIAKLVALNFGEPDEVIYGKTEEEIGDDEQ